MQKRSSEQSHQAIAEANGLFESTTFDPFRKDILGRISHATFDFESKLDKVCKNQIGDLEKDMVVLENSMKDRFAKVNNTVPKIETMSKEANEGVKELKQTVLVLENKQTELSNSVSI